MYSIVKKARAFMLAGVMALTGGAVAVVATPQPALAAGEVCEEKKLTQGFSLGVTIQPDMVAPVCYDGNTIRINGSVTPGVTSFGYAISDFSWAGWYGGGGFIGIGENFTATTFNNTVTFTCKPRWLINPKGEVYSYERNC